MNTIKEAGIEVEELAVDTANWARAEARTSWPASLRRMTTSKPLSATTTKWPLAPSKRWKGGRLSVDGGTFIPVVGVDCNEEAQLAIEEGTMYASVFNDAKSQADAVVKPLQADR